MRSKYYQRKMSVTRLVLITVIIGFIGVNDSVFSNNITTSCSTVANPFTEWNVTITINESSGASNMVILGEATNASEGQDTYDRPVPPVSPLRPAIEAWFETPLPLPFNKLLIEYKPYPSVYTKWNLSIIWLPELGNTTLTRITISWDSSQMVKQDKETLFLYENNTVLTNMVTTHSYSYITNGTLHRFQVISQSQQSNNPLDKIPLPFLSLFMFILVIFIVSILVVLLFNKMRKKSGVSKKKHKR